METGTADGGIYGLSSKIQKVVQKGTGDFSQGNTEYGHGKSLYQLDSPDENGKNVSHFCQSKDPCTQEHAGK